jgi:flagellar motor switch protein FliN
MALSSLESVDASETERIAETLATSPEVAARITTLAAAISQHASEGLGAILGQPVSFGPATLRSLPPQELESENWDFYHPVDLHWDIDGQTYTPLLLLPKSELQTLLPSAGGTADLPDMEALGSILRQLANQLSAEGEGDHLPSMWFSLPDAGMTPPEPGGALLRVQHTVAVGTPGLETEFTVVHLIPIAALRAVVNQGMGPDHGTPTDQLTASQPTPSYTQMPPGPSVPAPVARGAATTEETMASGPTATHPAQTAGTSIHPVQFQQFDADQDAKGGTNLDLLLDVSLRVSVELGRTELTIKDVLALGPGSVVELDKLAGEPVDILVNDRLIAKGEVVVVDENFGVRVTDIVSPQKRISRGR